MLRHRRLAAIAALACAAALPAWAQHAATPPQALEAWARPTVPGQPGGGAFVTLVGGSAPDRLVGARADVAQRVELHSMTMAGNVMQMRQVPAIAVPAGKTVALAPGGWHLMFSGLKRPLTVGEHFPLVLHFEHAGDVVVQVAVRTQAGPHGDHAMPMDMKMP
ncbi:MAG: copper chaperone PCu(A)C [Burkholderiales bacterium]|nr:copper chaperone PCu(A)C [Burkholderiales bacterium]